MKRYLLVIFSLLLLLFGCTQNSNTNFSDTLETDTDEICVMSSAVQTYFAEIEIVKLFAIMTDDFSGAKSFDVIFKINPIKNKTCDAVYCGGRSGCSFIDSYDAKRFPLFVENCIGLYLEGSLDEESIEYLIRGDESTEGFFSEGDLIKVRFNFNEVIRTNFPFEISLIPQSGLPIQSNSVIINNIKDAIFELKIEEGSLDCQ